MLVRQWPDAVQWAAEIRLICEQMLKHGRALNQFDSQKEDVLLYNIDLPHDILTCVSIGTANLARSAILCLTSDSGIGRAGLLCIVRCIGATFKVLPCCLQQVPSAQRLITRCGS